MMRNILFSLIHDIGAPLILRKLRIRNREISVFMFHRVSDECDLLWPSLPVETFRALAKELSKRTRVVRLEKIREIEEYPDKPLVALSFDDGYMDFWENALPILSDLGLPAHHNICPGLIDRGIPPWTQIINNFLQYSDRKSLEMPGGKIYRISTKFRQSDFMVICKELNSADNEIRTSWIESLLKRIPGDKITRLMDWDQIRECARSGIHIGSHGMSHINISKIENRDLLLAEIEESKTRIYEEVGIEPAIFAFPKGSYNSVSMQAVKETGYKIALLCEDMVTRFSETVQRDLHILPRINISRPSWKEENLRLLGFHQRLKSWIERAPYIFEYS